MEEELSHLPSRRGPLMMLVIMQTTWMGRANSGRRDPKKGLTCPLWMGRREGGLRCSSWGPWRRPSSHLEHQRGLWPHLSQREAPAAAEPRGVCTGPDIPPARLIKRRSARAAHSPFPGQTVTISLRAAVFPLRSVCWSPKPQYPRM